MRVTLSPKAARLISYFLIAFSVFFLAQVFLAMYERQVDTLDDLDAMDVMIDGLYERVADLERRPVTESPSLHASESAEAVEAGSTNN